MALTNPTVLASNTFSGKDITAGIIPIYTYTHTSPAANCWAIIEFWATVAGSGDYTAWLTKQWVGAGTAHDVTPHTTITLAATADLSPGSIIVQLFTGDVLNVMLKGLPADNSVSGGIRITSLNPSVFDATADNVLVAALSGITSLAAWLRGLARKDTMNATAKTELNSGDGGYDEATDSQEAERDNIGTAGANLTAVALADDAVDAGAVKTDAVTKIQSGLATSANQTTIINRIGAWTGTGVNTILGAFKALLSKAASNPTDVGGTFDAATDSTEAIRDKLDAGVNIVYTAQQLEDAVAGEELTAYRDCTYTASFADMGSLADRTKMFFTVKKSLNDDDAEAIVQIEETDGLLYLNGAAIASPIEDTDGSITVTDEVDGDATFQIAAAAMAELDIREGLFYDIAITKADGIKIRKTGGLFNVLGTSTRTWSDA